MKKKLIPLIALIGIMLDQLIKIIVVKKLDLFEQIVIVKNFFTITYVRNEGAAWSMFSGHSEMLIIVAILVLILFYFYFIRNQQLKKEEIILYGTLMGGIFGNLIDRILTGSVIDYLSFTIINSEFPVFNLADILIVVSIALLVIISFKGEKNENRNK
ncbi:MAG: signal peptidase II [Bacilli bacterium]